MVKRYPDGAWCVRVAGTSPKKNPKPIDAIAGDGRWGFSTRPQKDNTIEVEVDDGVMHKTRGRIKPRKAVRDLATRRECRGINALAAEEVRRQRPRFRARRGQSPARCR